MKIDEFCLGNGDMWWYDMWTLLQLAIELRFLVGCCGYWGPGPNCCWIASPSKCIVCLQKMFDCTPQLADGGMSGEFCWFFWVCSCPNWSDMVVGIQDQVQYTKPPRPQDFLTDWSIKIRSILKVSYISLTWWVLRGPPNRAPEKNLVSVKCQKRLVIPVIYTYTHTLPLYKDEHIPQWVGKPDVVAPKLFRLVPWFWSWQTRRTRRSWGWNSRRMPQNLGSYWRDSPSKLVSRWEFVILKRFETGV